MRTPASANRFKASAISRIGCFAARRAIKFTPAGGTVRVRVLPEPDPTVTVEDTGCGIPDDQLAHVFERFYRGDVSRSRGGGAGLGLSIAQWIATVHDARVTLTSNGLISRELEASIAISIRF